MARQRGIKPLTGTIGDITHYKMNGKYFSRAKSSLDSETVLNNAAFENSRKASGQFSRASTAARLIRTSLVQGIKFKSNREIHNRLLAKIRSMISAVETSAYKKCPLNDISWDMLTSFEFNAYQRLGNLLMEKPVITLKKESGNITIRIPSWKPLPDFKPYRSATHACIFASAVHINFNKEIAKSVTTDSGYLPLKPVQEKDIELTLSLKEPAKYPVFIAVGILGFEVVNQSAFEMIGPERSAMQILQVVLPTSPTKKTTISKKEPIPKKKKK